MGIRLLPLAGGDAFTLRATSLTIAAPLDAAVAELRVGSRLDLLDRASFAVLPRGRRAAIEAKSPVAHVLVLAASDALIEAMAGAYRGEVDPKRLERYVSEAHTLPRTNWMNEVFHRYLFERAVCRKRDNEATRFLETEIVKELYFLRLARDSSGDRRSVVEGEGALIERALKAIEARLFEADVVRGLARACGASESTLLRAFKRELGVGPLAYVRARRLDESILLLKSRRFSVSEVAAMVGYRNLAAFSEAFRARFGMRPSDLRSVS
jgi:AraC-like DNA-binding protein